MTEGTTMTAEREATCSNCVWRFGDQCRRFPPVTSLEIVSRQVVNGGVTKDTYDQKTYFPLVLLETFCGEHLKESTHE